MNLRSAALAFSGSMLLCTAQEAPRLLHLRIAGPAAWQSRLAPTDVGGMFASQQAEPLWRPWVERLEQAVRSVRGDDAAHAAERERVLGYSGTVHLVSWLEQAEDGVHVPRWSLALIAEPDGKTDMEAVAAIARNWTERLGGRASNAWRELEASPARVHDGRVLLVLASAEDAAAATRRAESLTLDPLGRNEVVRGELGIEAALGLLRDRAFERWFVRELVGQATQRVEFVLGAAGPRVQAEVAVRFGDGPRGLPGAFGMRPTTSLRARVPAGSRTHVALGIDAAAVWETIVAARAEALETTVEEQSRRLQKQLGCDLAKELFAQFETGAVLSWRARSLDEGVDGSLLADACIVLPLRAGADVRKPTLDLLRWIGVVPGEDPDGVVTGDFAGVLHIAVGFGVACLAVGAQRERQVEDVLAFAAERGTGAGQDVAGAAELGGSLDVASTVVRDVYAWTRAFATVAVSTEEWPSVQTVAQEARAWKGLLREHGLEAAKLEVPKDSGLRLVLRW